MIQERVQCGVVRLVCLCLAISMSGVLLGCVDSSQSSRVLTVFAASSLTDAFTDLGKGFEAEVPGAEVRFAFAGS